MDIERLRIESGALTVARIAPLTGRQNAPKTAAETNALEVSMAAPACPAATRPVAFFLPLECYSDARRYVVGVVVSAAEFAIVVDVGGNAIIP